MNGTTHFRDAPVITVVVEHDEPSVFCSSRDDEVWDGDSVLADSCELVMEIDGSGDLVFRVGGETIRHHKPLIYQQTGQARRRISGRYVAAGSRRVRFEIGEYDRNLPLTIDPVVSYSTTDASVGDSPRRSVWSPVAYR